MADTPQNDAASSKAPASPGKKRKQSKRKQEASWRETVEAIAITFVMAFLVKTFQADAYVIPTGSMGPTLFGRQKEVTCSECGHHFPLGASYEVQPDSTVLMNRITKADCVNCGARLDVMNIQPNNGDRIFVNKQIDDFKRFDVVVFKNPEESQENYIKRLIGLPGETIRIRKGDLWAKQTPESPWKILRKQDPAIQRDIQLTVYDDRHPARTLLEAGWPERWEPSQFAADASSTGFWAATNNGLTPDRENRTFRFEASEESDWLRYRNFASNYGHWDHHQKFGTLTPETQIITDFCSFNAITSSISLGGSVPSFDQGSYWVGDLTLNAVFSPEKSSRASQLVLELVEGSDTFQCVWNGQGTIQFKRLNTTTRELIEELGTAQQAFPTSATALSFANVDDRLCLWVNDELITFDESGEYQSTDRVTVDIADLAPCGIAVRNLTGTLSELVIQRDLYYQNDFAEMPAGFVGRPVIEREFGEMLDPRDPVTYQSSYNQAQDILANKHRQFAEYKLADDEYMMMGDNSSRSQDARMFSYISRPYAGEFSSRFAVRKRHMIGKALCIWWPHGIPVLNGGKGFAIRKHTAGRLGRRGLSADDQEELNKLTDYAHPTFRFPFLPNIQRMKAIR